MNPANQGQGFFGVKVSKPGVSVNQANQDDLVYESDYTSTIYYDHTNSRIVEGKLPDGNYGLWVSKPGFNANDPSASSDNNLIFNSNQDIFKVVTSGTTTIPAFNTPASTLVWDSLVIPHGLPFVPVLQAYGLVNQFYNFNYPSINVETVQSYVALPFNAQTGSILDINVTVYQITAGVDSTNVYFGWLYETTLSGSGGTGYNFPAVPIRYYLLRETAN